MAYTSRFYQLVGWLEKILKRKYLKRKAVSPLQVSGVNAAILSTDQACTGVVNSQAGSVYNNNQNTPCKQVHQSSPEYFNFNSYTGYTRADMQHLVYNMNVPQSPFGGFMRPVQSPPYGSQCHSTMGNRHHRRS